MFYLKKLIGIFCVSLSIILILMNTSLFGGTQASIQSPEIQGFSLKGKPMTYTPDTLYEYINGAADLYLNYHFKKLTVFEYRNKEKGSITVDIYEHKDMNNGFGIYCSEKPRKGNFMKIGTEGYYEQGVLNFYKGKYYVKVSSFGIKKDEKKILSKLTHAFAKQFKSKSSLPKAIIGFPKKNLVTKSEKYISKNFLGHAFLHSAFVADYKIANSPYQVFIIETEDEKDIKQILEKYMAFLKKKDIIIEKENGILSFIDPYYKSKGRLYIKYRKNHMWGMFSKDAKIAKSMISHIDSRLKKTF